MTKKSAKNRLKSWREKITASLRDASREKVIARAGVVDIMVNLLLAVFKIIVGLVANSIAITSDAVHGLVDTVSGVIILISSKISQQKGMRGNEKKVARVERAATIIITAIVMIVGVTVLVESIHKLIEPEEADYSAPILIILVASVLGKLGLGLYLRRQGKKVSADALVAASVESLNDVLISGAVLVAAVIHVIWNIDIEAYISTGIGVIIIKLGVELILDLKNHTRESKNHTPVIKNHTHESENHTRKSKNHTR